MVHLAHDLNFHPYKDHVAQQLSDCYSVACPQVHHQFLELMAGNLDMPVYILIGDGTYFHFHVAIKETELLILDN
jgi:hypothetical protein